MSYLKKEYRIVPKSSYNIIRPCSGCQKKSNFINTHHFRVNANGKHLDIWLIYQCQACKHTYNLTLFHRCKSQSFSREVLHNYMTNDYDLTFKWGLDKSLFHNNKAIIDENSLVYEIEETGHRLGQEMIIHNPYNIKLRLDKVLSEIFKLSRSQVKQMIKSGKIKSGDKYISSKCHVHVDMTL